jgi:mannose-6-phosphate isomerase-like protein (cupin superfamily)
MQKQFTQFALKSFPGQGAYTLTPMEVSQYADFEVKRVYWLSGVEEVTRSGQHCHHSEQEIFILMHGSATVVIDEGKHGEGKVEYQLKHNDAFYVPAYVWHGFKDVQPGTTILALSSTNYSPDRSDYIEDYEEFKRLTRG